MKVSSSLVLLSAATAQAGVISWPQQGHHAVAMPCGHHRQQGQVHEKVTQNGVLRVPHFTHISVAWPASFSTKAKAHLPDILNNVLDRITGNRKEDHDGEDFPPKAETVAKEDTENDVVTIKLDAAQTKDEDEDEVEEMHEDLRKMKAKRSRRDYAI